MRVALLCTCLLALTPGVALSQSGVQLIQVGDLDSRILNDTQDEHFEDDLPPSRTVQVGDRSATALPPAGPHLAGYGGGPELHGHGAPIPGGHECHCGPNGHVPPCRFAHPYCEFRGTWWEAMPGGGLVRQIELHPSGKYNEVIFHRSGQRVDVVIGSYLVHDAELTLLVENLPQIETRAAVVTVGGQEFEVLYTLGSSGPFVVSCNPPTGQIVLTDASGASRVWMRHPPPRFGLLATGLYHGRGYHNPFPWLPNGSSDLGTSILQRGTAGSLEPRLMQPAPMPEPPPRSAAQPVYAHSDSRPSDSSGHPGAGPASYERTSYESAPYEPASYGAAPHGPEPYGPEPYGPEPYGPEPYGPQPYGPQPYGPQPYGPEMYGPAMHGPESYGPGLCGCGQPDCHMNSMAAGGGPFGQAGGFQGGDQRKSWISFDFLMWSMRGMRLPALVTTSPTDTPREQAGVLGQMGTQVLFGGNEVLKDDFQGERFRVGHWFNNSRALGVSGEYIRFGSESESFTRSSMGNPILARPFFNTQDGRQASELIAFPGIVDGTVEARATSELVGAGVHLRSLRRCVKDCQEGRFGSRSEALIGWRYLKSDESVQVTESLVSTVPDTPGSFDIFDRFETTNEFNGLDCGWLYQRRRDKWSCDFLMRLAIGMTQQTVRIKGQTTIMDPSTTPMVQTLAGGLLAQTSNIGTYSRDEFTVVPEFNANLGYQLTNCLRFVGGYSAIYWSSVVQPGEQISTDINPELLPPPNNPITGAQRPQFVFRETSWWGHGFNFGLDLSF